jgi:Hemerythrin HHE cation binding domain
MTITELDTPRYDLEVVTFDLYRDIHKGIRAELFAVTSAAGSLDPTDRCGRVALADHITSVGRVLASHAEHEDAVIDPVLADHLPVLAEQITRDHHELEARYDWIVELAGDAAGAGAAPDQRRLGHLLYLGLSEFTGAYLTHQLVEERDVMPALERAVGVEAVVGMHMAIISSIPPAEMAASLAFMLPAMNADDRAELLGGMRAAAPADAFAGVVSLARSVLDPVEFAATAERVELD